jgi:hypothetical protein
MGNSFEKTKLVVTVNTVQLAQSFWQENGDVAAKSW